MRETLFYRNKVARGRFSHSLLDDFVSLSSLFLPNRTAYINEFEIELSSYVGRRFCDAFPMARTAMYFALRALGAKKGSKIIMPPITIKAILDVVLSLELIPIFVDIDENTAFFNLDKLREVVAVEKPSFCLFTYLFGVAPDVKNHIKLLNDSEVVIIEDFSQGLNLGREKKWSGTIGKISIYSASAVKTLDTYGGGFAFTDDLDLHLKLETYKNNLAPTSRKVIFNKITLSLIKNLVTRPPIFNLVLFPLLQLANKLGKDTFDRFVGKRSYSPIKELPAVWFQSYSGWQAKRGLIYLQRVRDLDYKRAAFARAVIANAGNIRFVTGSNLDESVFWQLIIISKNQKALRDSLLANGIDSSLSSLILISNLLEYGLNFDTPIAKKLIENGVYIPCYVGLDKEFAQRIVKIIKDSESTAL